jgi:hypothetical protein
LQTANSVKMAEREFSDLETGIVEGSEISVIGLDWLALVGPITISAAS